MKNFLSSGPELRWRFVTNRPSQGAALFVVKDFFDNMGHELVMKAVRKHIEDILDGSNISQLSSGIFLDFSDIKEKAYPYVL